MNETHRVRAHLTRVHADLTRATPAALSPGRAARRRAVLAHLARYIAAERYPRNRVSAAPTPVFVDAEGARCAVAALLEATGRGDVVARVARTANRAYVRALAGDPALGAWLAEHGLSLDDAARIQPAYNFMPQAQEHWQPTVAIVASVHGGGAIGPLNGGGQAALAPTLRLGARLDRRETSAAGAVAHRSWGFMLEYSRSFVLDRGSTNQLGLLVQYEFAGYRDAQWYVLGGPVVSVDEDASPGTGAGGQLGFGFSLRTQTVPLLFEVVTQALTQGPDVALRGGLQVGAVW